MRALIHFHAGGDYQPQAFLPRSACQPSLLLPSRSLILSHSLSCDSRSFCPSSFRLPHFRLSLLSFRCASQTLLDCSLLGGYSDNVVGWSGCSIKDSVVVVVIVVDDYDKGDHVIAAVFKLHLCIYMYAHAKRARHIHVEPRGDRSCRGAKEAAKEAVDVYLYRDCSHAFP